ncbi:MAG: hypothetical protein SOY04_12660 [Clostridium celatum]|nr:hypothetical protein [Clostridium celatum]
MTNYHKVDSKILEFDLDSVEFKFGMWITKKEFGQRLNDVKPLPKGQFYMSVRVVAKDVEITEKVARRLIKQFTKLDIIRLIATSTNPKEGSIYEYLVQVEKGTVEDTVRAQLGHSKSEEISDFEEAKWHSKGTYEGTVKGTSKKKNKSKENNYIYMDLKFIDDVIDKVNITEAQYSKLINKFTVDVVNKEILALDNYIANGKGNKYKDHYRALNTWCSKSKEKAGQAKPKSMESYID